MLLGTTTESQANADDLTVATSGHTGITIRSGTSNNGSVFFSDGTSGNDEFRAYVQYNHTDNRLVFGTNAAEVARIDSSGNLVVGATDAESFKFKVSNGAGLLGRFTDGTSQTLDIRQTTGGIELQNPNNGFISIKGSSTERVRFTSTGGVHFNNGELIEQANIVANKLSAAPNIDLENGMVHLFTTTETTTSTPNIRINSSTSLNSVMAIGEVISVTLITTAAAAGYSEHLTIDGGAVTENWTGGSPPNEGGSSGVDIYAYTIIKTADATFTVVATQTKTS